MNQKKIDFQINPLISTATVAKWLGVSPRTVCLWAECREIPAVKIGRHWRFREEELKQWLDSTQARMRLERKPA